MVKQIEDTINHKKLFMDSANLLFKMLVRIGEDEMAIALIRRAAVHDNSKFSLEEIDALSKIADKQEKDDGFTNPDYKLNNEQLDLISIHWKNNRHHPEHFDSVYDMTTLDVLEMVCDWHARSVEFGTDLIEFVEHRQKNRFHFPPELFDSILRLCKLMVAVSHEGKLKKTQ